MATRVPGLIALFDVDGTLTTPRKVVTPDMLEFMREIEKAMDSMGLVWRPSFVVVSAVFGRGMVEGWLSCWWCLPEVVAEVSIECLVMLWVVGRGVSTDGCVGLRGCCGVRVRCWLRRCCGV
ncbi:hypothetical protein Droror1_Dr00023642 [Drosera rotundifolia]